MKTLRDVLPAEFKTEFMYVAPRTAWSKIQLSPAARLLDVEVVEEVDGRECRWPGPHRNVMVWWKLKNGKAVGWNENPGRGWSFPVHGGSK